MNGEQLRVEVMAANVGLPIPQLTDNCAHGCDFTHGCASGNVNEAGC